MKTMKRIVNILEYNGDMVGFCCGTLLPSAVVQHGFFRMSAVVNAKKASIPTMIPLTSPDPSSATELTMQLIA